MFVAWFNIKNILTQEVGLAVRCKGETGMYGEAHIIITLVLCCASFVKFDVYKANVSSKYGNFDS